jgi:hypothetical protein
MNAPKSTAISHPLAGCWAKIDRAKEQVRDLDTEITALLKSGIYTVVGENQFERRRYVFKLLGPPVPLRIAVIAGEIIHHLRSCFDYVVWALASKSGLFDTERVNFPVCETPRKFASAVKNGILKGVPKVARPAIEDLQPYRASDPRNSSLQIVHDLDIADKHKLLVVVTHALDIGNMRVITKNDCTDPTFGIELPPITTDRQGQLTAEYPWEIEDGIEVHWIPLRGPANPQFEMESPASTVQIAFEQIGTLRRPPVIPILMQLCNFVETAIHKFDAFF